jgi:hypothetical protein
MKGHLYLKKIILSTDLEIIKDGVQQIDYDFLKWFVNNTDCEEVETIYDFFNPMGRKVNPFDLTQNLSKCVWKYNIIIPQEEPDYTALLQQVGTRQETLEEAAERAVNSCFKQQSLFKLGANWQAEQIHGQDYLQGFIDQFGDGELGELDPKEWDALAFLKWLKLNNFEIIKKK